MKLFSYVSLDASGPVVDTGSRRYKFVRRSKFVYTKARQKSVTEIQREFDREGS